MTTRPGAQLPGDDNPAAKQQVERGMAFAGPVHGTVNFFAVPPGSYGADPQGRPHRDAARTHEAFRSRLRELSLGSSRLITALTPDLMGKGARAWR